MFISNIRQLWPNNIFLDFIVDQTWKHYSCFAVYLNIQTMSNRDRCKITPQFLTISRCNLSPIAYSKCHMEERPQFLTISRCNLSPIAYSKCHMEERNYDILIFLFYLFPFNKRTCIQTLIVENMHILIRLWKTFLLINKMPRKCYVIPQWLSLQFLTM